MISVSVAVLEQGMIALLWHHVWLTVCALACNCTTLLLKIDPDKSK